MKNDSFGFLTTSLGAFHTRLRGAGFLYRNKIDACVAGLPGQRVCLLLSLVSALLLIAPRQLAAQNYGKYRVDTQASQIEIHLFKGGLLSALGENHLISLTHFSGSANLPKADAWTAELSGEAASLKVIDPWGDPEERKEVQDTMLGPKQLDVSHFPSIELHSVSFDPTDHDTAWHLDADVKLHGVTRKVKFSLNCQQIGDKLQIQGKKMFKLTDFNIQPFSTALGAIRIRNDFEVTYNIVLDRIH